MLSLHFFTRVHGHQVTPLKERHFYPASYLVALSLNSGHGFKYLLPSSTQIVSGKEGLGGAELALGTPPEGDPSAAVVNFMRLDGRETVSSQEFQSYLSAGTRTVSPNGPPRTRVLDIYLTAALWRLFGISWPVYFIFYSLVSTVTSYVVFFIARRASASHWCGLAAALGFLASPLEHYSEVWSIRDTAPLWFAALAFFVLLRFAGTTRGGLTAILSWFALGFTSLLGLGWRADAQLIPPFLLAGLILMLATGGRSWRDMVLAICSFLVGCLAVLSLIRGLGPESYGQGATVFPIAWYGESSRSNLLHTENVFQVARDDYLTLYQANYFAAMRFGVGPEAAPIQDINDTQLHRRCRAMYLELARYNAFSWWAAFPSFLVRSLRVDRPTLLGSEDEARQFFERRMGWLKPLSRCCLDRYGSCLPYLFLLGLIGGVLRQESRLLTGLLAAYFVYYAAAVFLALPEPKHMSPLLLPLHVLAAVGLWSIVTAVRSWRRVLRFGLQLQRLAASLVISVALVLCWGILGVTAYRVSRDQRGRFVQSVLDVAANGQDAPESLASAKLFSVRSRTDAPNPPVGYLLKIRASRPAQLLCIQVRDSTSRGRFLAYYTRHRIQPGRDWLFFFNVVSGVDTGDDRPYSAWVRLVGPATLVSSRKLDLSRWPLGLPLSFVFGEGDALAGSPFIGDDAPATDLLPTSFLVETLLSRPRVLLKY